MYSLAIDTSNQSLSVAVYNDTFEKELTIENTLQHGVTLLPTIDTLLKQTGITFEQIQNVVVSNGPGSYTGLRVGVTAAKVIVYSKNIPLYSCSSLDVLAVPYRDRECVVSFFDARRNHVYVTMYKNGQKILEDSHLSFEKVLSHLSDENTIVFVSPDIERFEQEIKQVFDNVELVKDTVSALCMKKVSQTIVDCHIHTPTYIKAAQAQEEWEEKNGVSHSVLVETSRL